MPFTAWFLAACVDCFLADRVDILLVLSPFGRISTTCLNEPKVFWWRPPAAPQHFVVLGLGIVQLQSQSRGNTIPSGTDSLETGRQLPMHLERPSGSP